MRKGKIENNTIGKLNGKKDGGRQRKTEEEPPLAHLQIFDTTTAKNYLAHLLY